MKKIGVALRVASPLCGLATKLALSAAMVTSNGPRFRTNFVLSRIRAGRHSGLTIHVLTAGSNTTKMWEAR